MSVINTNYLALVSQSHLQKSQSALGTAIERLSSGLRINSAKDDAAGFAIAERFLSNIRGLSQVARDTSDGVSLAQTAQGALSATNDSLQRMRELAVQAGNGTLSSADREKLQKEFEQLSGEVDRVAKSTAFNGQKLLDGSFSAATFQVGPSAGDNVTVGGMANTQVDSLGQSAYASAQVAVDAAKKDSLQADLAAGDVTLTITGADGKNYTSVMQQDSSLSADEALGKLVATVNQRSADTGVTKSDLSIWREHLVPSADAMDARLVVLNKIDTLWDALSTPEQVQLQIASQRTDSAEVLGLSPEKVLAVSAQKGLLAKVSKDEKLLQASNLLALEAALGEGLLGRRRQILSQAVGVGVNALRQEAGRLVHTRSRDILEQTQELEGLRGKNTGVIKQMRLRIEQEQADFDASGAKIQAVRSVHLRLLKELFALLDYSHLRRRVSELAHALKQPGIKLGVRRAYTHTFKQLGADVKQAETLAADIQAMLEGSFKSLNTEYGFSLQPPSPPQLAAYQKDLDLIEKSHVQYMALGNSLRQDGPG